MVASDGCMRWNGVLRWTAAERLTIVPSGGARRGDGEGIDLGVLQGRTALGREL